MDAITEALRERAGLVGASSEDPPEAGLGSRGTDYAWVYEDGADRTESVFDVGGVYEQRSFQVVVDAVTACTMSDVRARGRALDARLQAAMFADETLGGTVWRLELLGVEIGRAADEKIMTAIRQRWAVTYQRLRTDPYSAG